MFRGDSVPQLCFKMEMAKGQARWGGETRRTMDCCGIGLASRSRGEGRGVQVTEQVRACVQMRVIYL